MTAREATRLFNRLIFKRRSIIFSWLLSYVAILLVPVLISIFTYTQTNQTIIDEINRSNNLIIAKVQKDMDSQLEDINRMSVEIALNPQVQELLNIKESLKPEQFFTVFKAFENLKVYKTSSRSKHYFVYFKSIDMVLTPDISNTSEDIYNNRYANNQISYANWIELLGQYYRGEYVRIGDELAYIRSLPVGRNGVSLGNVVIFMDQSQFWVSGSEDYIHDGVALIMDKNDRILTSTVPLDGQLPVTYNDLQDKSGVIKGKLNKQDVVVSYISSGVTDWKYMIIMPEHVFWDKSEYIKKATVIGLLVCLLIGGGLTYAFVRKNYSPVLAIMELFKDKKNRNELEEKQLNEYDFMRQAIHHTLSENTDMSSRLWRQKSFMRGHFIERLLKGRANSISMELSLETYGIRFVTDAFAVMIVNVDDYHDTSFQLIQFAIMNVTEELTSQKNQGFMTEVDGLLVCLINFKGQDPTDWKQDLSRIASGAQDFMDKNYHVPISISISSPHYASIGISKAYEEALEAMEYQNIYGVTGIIHYSDMEIPRTKGEYYYPLEKEQALMNCIKTGDFASAEHIINEIFKDNLEQRKLPLKIAKCLFVDLVSTMLKTINEIGSIGDNSFLEALNPIERLLKCQTVSDMKQQLKEILQSFCGYMEQEKAGKRTNEILQSIMDMVHLQYNDINLSIASIGERIGLHPAYVSKLFKEGTGTSLLDYMAKFRIEQAKEMMKGQDPTMESIALKVGFTNVRTFRRVFAKYEGITPGKYSDLI
ncbi:HTH-type transcriptional regulator YesS [compost metagenome]